MAKQKPISAGRVPPCVAELLDSGMHLCTTYPPYVRVRAMPAEPHSTSPTDHENENLKVRYLLEMNAPDQLQPAAADQELLTINLIDPPCPEFSWFLHQWIGTPFRWGGRESWTAADWEAFATDSQVQTWVASVGGGPAGYFELQKQADGSVQICCFGLAERFIGQGLGGVLLSAAVRQAWAMKTSRVWLATCSHDHPHALANYEARGFKLVERSEHPANNARESTIFHSR